MHYVYIDEAGTSAPEPVSVVVGIIVHVNMQGKLIASMKQIREKHVPPHFQQDFTFHATALLNDKRYRKNWNEKERSSFVHAMMSLPRQLGIPISIGIVRRKLPASKALIEDGRYSIAQFHHALAFYLCEQRVNKYLRDHFRDNEVAEVIAEKVPKMQAPMQRMQANMRETAIVLSPSMLSPTSFEKSYGFIVQDHELSISKIKDGISFRKKDEPLLQIADACAFGFRRYFAGQSNGREYVQSILGFDLIPTDWAGLMSARYFTFPKRIYIVLM